MLHYLEAGSNMGNIACSIGSHSPSSEVRTTITEMEWDLCRFFTRIGFAQASARLKPLALLTHGDRSPGTMYIVALDVKKKSGIWAVRALAWHGR